ncbi:MULTISPECIES: hypothetical protein [unclassified Rhodococcus (in: high G+C Gram-positive bacteria)]|uniref:hypothetical protein n=1 Tax=unclassified Rhodococcus (in: high G+C Gram-positive bacteria) TaxID=192944 RepID=UPI000B9B64DE|nr:MULTISPECIES: hypothetical protein [unclassified Rhodococcus (in: high G+C Gram-positive bacteria)]OZE35575.1 hypothetical protein CH259_16230 [Rhodococcus sp. 05-2254-4]OZE48004.1 hypothetical protein CH261_08825 [Rhodococcus sp. 05-2254-3]OZE49215.1 hypothetical protein CH283_16610 [Rhodococcus sp. 05-2254-2]
MAKTEITAKTLTDIITAAGHSPRHFDIKATLAAITAHNEDEDTAAPVDIETATEWLDETGTTGTTYQLCPWLAA